MRLVLFYETFIIFIIVLFVPTKPVQVLRENEEITENIVTESPLKDCLKVEGRTNDLGVCFGKEVLNTLLNYDEQETFSLASGVSFVRDDKTPRDIGAFLDKDPMDFRSMLEGASSLISRRSLHWDLSGIYPGLIMKVGPTLADGVLEFVMDPRIKDRGSNTHEELSTGRLLARNLLVPFLMGFKFQLSTLLPLVLGLILLASKKAFVLAKFAILAVTLFSGGSGYGNYNSYSPGLGLQSYTSAYEPQHHYQGHHNHHGSGSYYNRHPHHVDYWKSSEQTTGTPITPGELRDRLERLFVTKNEMDPNRDVRDENRDKKIRNARNFAWSPVT